MAVPALLRHAFTPPATDADLLARFVRSRDEPAFAELVRRHGPVVYRVCRRLLGPADADDAFQATFLVLATRATAVRKAGSVGSWLIGVAGRVARQMRKASLRRHHHEQASGGVHPRRPESPPDTPDLARVLDEELTRLPESLRAAVVVCLLQGRTQEQAVSELGGSVRTIRRRLDEAKRLLRLRLERRGVVPAVAAGLAAGVGEVSAGFPADLGRRAVATVFDFLAGGAASAPVAVIAKGVAMGALARKVKVFMVTAALGLTGLGVGLADGPPEPKPDPGVVPTTAAPDRIPPLELPPAGNPNAVIPPPVAAPPAPGQTVRVMTENFVVTAPTAELAHAVGEAAERHRRSLAWEWLGRDLPNWPQPCKVTVAPGFGGLGGATTFTFGDGDKPAVRSMEMKLTGDLQQIMTSALPHEVMHTILATHFGKPLPRWADEGIAVTAESATERHTHDVRCRELLNQGRGIRLKTLFELKEYPKDMIVLFAQGYSVCQFLLTRPLPPSLTMFDLVKSPPPHPDVQARRGLLVFLANATGELGWDKAANAVYGFESVDDLQEAWVAWLSKPPAAPPVVAAAPPLPAPPLPVPTVGRPAPLPAPGANGPVGRAVANEAANMRLMIAQFWFGERPTERRLHVVEAREGQPIPPPGAGDLTIVYLRDGKPGSDTTVEFADGKLRSAWVNLAGPLEEVLEDQIPRELTRALVAEHFGRPVPAWVEMGPAVMFQSRKTVAENDRRCRELVEQGKALRLSALLTMTTRSPAVVATQAQAVVRFLLTRPVESGVPVLADLPQVGKLFRNKSAQPAAVIGFIHLGLRNGWDKAVKQVYGFDSVDALEAAWLDWLKTPASKLDRPTPVPPPPATPPLIPPVKLSAAEPARVGRITIEGNTVTAQRVILNQLGLYPGQILQYPMLEQARQNLIRLGIFDQEDPPTVELVPQESDSIYKDVRVRVKETRTGMVTVEVGPNSNPGAIRSVIATPTPVSTRTLKLPVRFGDRRKDVTEARLLASRDEGKTWEVVETIAPDKDGFVFTAKEDGLYWLNLVLVHKDGQTDPPDPARAAPAVKLLVDTTPPKVRITSARRDGDHIRVEWEVDEKYPDEAATRVYFQVDGSREKGEVRDESGAALRSVRFKPDGTGAVTVRVVVQDRAGNKVEVKREVPAGG